jgi:hypothetical protein
MSALTEVLAAHQWDERAMCRGCNAGPFPSGAALAEHQAEMVAASGVAVIELPSVAHCGPHDTDAKFFRQVADRMDVPSRRIDYLGGGNVRAAVQTLLTRAAHAAEAVRA